MESCYTGRAEETASMAGVLTTTVPEAARRLGIGRQTAYDAVRQGEIPSIRIARRILVPIAALEALLRGQAGPSEPVEKKLAPGRRYRTRAPRRSPRPSQDEPNA